MENIDIFATIKVVTIIGADATIKKH